MGGQEQQSFRAGQKFSFKQPLRLVRVIASGGMGTVWEGRMLLPYGVERPVAVKVLNRATLTDAAQRFLLREALVGLAHGHQHRHLVRDAPRLVALAGPLARWRRCSSVA